MEITSPKNQLAKIRLPVALFGIGLVLIGAPSTARATLGGPASSVADDAAQMKATEGINIARPLPGLPAENALASPNFAVQRMTTPEGTVVSEYIGQSGTVFAVTWRGPTPPNVATLLGSYFKQYSDAANAGAPGRFGPHVSSVHASDVTVETAGNMALFWGRAYLPAALPAGVSLSEIK
jgi:Protein of unknown function (DUF2844)